MGDGDLRPDHLQGMILFDPGSAAACDIEKNDIFGRNAAGAYRLLSAATAIAGALRMSISSDCSKSFLASAACEFVMP